MQTLSNLQRQIDTATDLQSVVTTMKTLAAVSIQQYERAAEALTTYNRTIELGMQIVLRDTEVHLKMMPSQQVTSHTSVGVIVFGSDQGMCGQFNEQLVTFAVDQHRQRHSGLPVAVIAVGSRAAAALVDVDWEPRHTFRVPTSVSEITDLVEEMLPLIEHLRETGQISTYYIYSNRRAADAAFAPGRLQLLPIAENFIQHWRECAWESTSRPTYAADENELFSQLVQQYLFGSLYRSCAESLASENASRITAMQAAEKNIEERLEDLQAGYHHLRQTAITAELLDVVIGFEAITKSSR